MRNVIGGGLPQRSRRPPRWSHPRPRGPVPAPPPPPRDLGGDRAGEADQRMLRCAVRRDVLASAEPRDGCDVHHAPPAPREHSREERLDAQERAGRVRRQDALPVLQRGLLHRRRVADPGVVHEDVHVAESRLRLAGEGPYALRVGDVAGDRPRPPSRSAERPGGRLEAVRASGCHDYCRARLGERAGHGQPNAPAAAGDDRAPSGQRHCASSASTASSRIAPKTSIVRAPSSARASAGDPKYARGPPACSKLVCPARIAPLTRRGLAGREPRTVSRTNSGRAASTIQLSYRPAWQAPLRNSSVSRTAQGFFVTSGNTIRAPSVRRICVTAASMAPRCAGSKCALATARRERPCRARLRARSTSSAVTVAGCKDTVPGNPAANSAAV